MSDSFLGVFSLLTLRPIDVQIYLEMIGLVSFSEKEELPAYLDATAFGVFSTYCYPMLLASEETRSEWRDEGYRLLRSSAGEQRA